MANSEAKVKSFYGSTSKRINKSWEEKKRKLEKCASDFRQKPILSTRKLRIDDPFPVFETFPRQQMAFDFARTCHEDVHVFAKEKDVHGKRVYIVATLPQFWYKYTRECSPEDRNYYEVIPEGAACRLYFDLEFKTEFNQEKNGMKMVDIFIKWVCCHLKDIYGLNCDRKSIIDLDSSTSAKFSRHLIFHLPGAVYKDNINVGNFVRHICALLKTRLETGTEKDTHVKDCVGNSHNMMQKDDQFCEALSATHSRGDVPSPDDGKDNEGKVEGVNHGELKELIINDGKGGFGTFCDEGVYTRNRNFRIFRSTKIGKNSHLLLSNQNTFKPSFKDRKGSFSKDPEYLLFLDSLVSNVSMQVGGKDVNVLTCESCIKSKKNSSHSEAKDLSCQVPSQHGYEHSPYPDIDMFILQVVNKGGVQGEIRRWVFFPQGKSLTYDILKNRWCENIGRPHKSNHIMIVVDLRLGVYYQKCHDPECKRIDYRSPEKSLPEEINPLFNAQFGEYLFESDDDDQDLCKAIAEFEELSSNHAHGEFSSENQHSSNRNNFNNEDVNVTGGKRTATQDDFDLYDEEGDEALMEVDLPQEVDQSTKFPKVCQNSTFEAPQANGHRECLESANKRPTLRKRKPNGATKDDHLESNDDLESTSREKPLLEIWGSDDKLDSTSDEDASVWLVEDPVSDLELSFAAEEVENRT